MQRIYHPLECIKIVRKVILFGGIERKTHQHSFIETTISNPLSKEAGFAAIGEAEFERGAPRKRRGSVFDYLQIDDFRVRSEIIQDDLRCFLWEHACGQSLLRIFEFALQGTLAQTYGLECKPITRSHQKKTLLGGGLVFFGRPQGHPTLRPLSFQLIATRCYLCFGWSPLCLSPYAGA